MRRKIAFALCIGATLWLTACGSSKTVDDDTDVTYNEETYDTDVTYNEETYDEDVAMIDDIEEDYAEEATYMDAIPLSEVNSLNGIYRLNTSEETLIPLYDTVYFKRIEKFDGEKFDGYICCPMAEYPVSIDQSKGEQLVLVGTEAANRAESESDIINIYTINVVGYGNYSMLNDLQADEMQEIQGIDLSQNGDDVGVINDALEGTGLSYHYYSVLNDSFRYVGLLVSQNQEATVTYSEYEGTQYVTTNVSMINPYYLVDWSDYTTVSIEKTQNGYFIVDTSSLPSGTYMVASYSGNYPIIIN
jgi:hypothetical protein